MCISRCGVADGTLVKSSCLGGGPVSAASAVEEQQAQDEEEKPEPSQSANVHPGVKVETAAEQNQEDIKPDITAMQKAMVAGKSRCDSDEAAGTITAAQPATDVVDSDDGQHGSRVRAREELEEQHASIAKKARPDA